jgi:hypothetical protein
MDTVRAMLERDLPVTAEEALVAYDINRHPTSSTSFWKGGEVGGFAAAQAKTWFRTDDGWDWVWGTPRMATQADGSMDYTLRFSPDEGCSATVAGVAVVRIRASSEAFDAMAGNQQNENETDQLQFLRGTQYLGKKATEWLILRGRGRTTKSFQRFVADDLKEQVEGEVTAAVEAEAVRLAEQALNSLLEEMGLDLDLSDIELPDFELPNVKELLEEALGIEIPDVEAWINDGLEAAWNLFFVANTYATANGFLVVRVGSKAGAVRAGTRVHYARQNTEETAAAMTWTGEMCQETMVSDVQANALTIHTEGQAAMVAEAMSRFGFGNGQASAFLESMNLQILASICVCPARFGGQDNTFSVTVEGQIGAYTSDEAAHIQLPGSVDALLNTIQQNLETEMNRRFDRRQYSAIPDDQLERMLREPVAAWAAEHAYAWTPCVSTE